MACRIGMGVARRCDMWRPPRKALRDARSWELTVATQRSPGPQCVGGSGAVPAALQEAPKEATRQAGWRRASMSAPLQLIALTFRLDADAESRLLEEVDRIEGRGVLRVLDMVFVAKRQDGTVEGLEAGDDEDFGSLLASVSPFGAGNGSRPVAGNGAASEPAGPSVAAVQAVAD